MQKEFTKSDLKDGMILHAEDGAKTTLVSDFYTTKEDLKIADGRIFGKVSGLEIIKIEYGGQVIWEKPTKRMTVYEMQQELEKLTGEKIEIIEMLSKKEMIGACYEHCDRRVDGCTGCCLNDGRSCKFCYYSDEELKQCYEKVMGNGI